MGNPPGYFFSIYLMIAKWWTASGKSNYLKFLHQLIPLVITWQLWVYRNKSHFEGLANEGLKLNSVRWFDSVIDLPRLVKGEYRLDYCHMFKIRLV